MRPKVHEEDDPLAAGALAIVALPWLALKRLHVAGKWVLLKLAQGCVSPEVS
jgi:hypothetical protein